MSLPSESWDQVSRPPKFIRTWIADFALPDLGHHVKLPIVPLTLPSGPYWKCFLGPLKELLGVKLPPAGRVTDLTCSSEFISSSVLVGSRNTAVGRDQLLVHFWALSS